MDSTRVNEAKRLFMLVAAEVCPGFTVREEYKPILHDLVLWCLGDPTGGLSPRKGLWLWGDIGTGKSTLVEILRRLWPGLSPIGRYQMRISNVTDVCAIYQADGYDALQTFVQWRVQAFDEVGSETIPTSHFADRENVMQYLLQRRYDRRSRTLTIVTTNLDVSQIAERYEARIFDRCKQMFNLIALRGNTFRQW